MVIDYCRAGRAPGGFPKLPPPISPERGIFFKYCIRVLVCRDKSENGFDVIGGLKSMFDLPSFWAYTLAILNIDLHQGHQPTHDKDQAIQNYIFSKKKVYKNCSNWPSITIS